MTTLLHACRDCATPFTPTRPGHQTCPTHTPTGKQAMSPTRQAMNKTYYRNRTIILRDHPACALRIHCDGAPATQVDHIVPVTHGGTHALTNMQPACKSCNSSKQAGPRKTLSQWKAEHSGQTPPNAPQAQQPPANRLA
jgi:5-methylcytosine-specific restriction protein A